MSETWNQCGDIFPEKIRADLLALTINDAKRDVGYYLMNYYNWERPHQFNDGLAPARAEKLAKKVSGFYLPLHYGTKLIGENVSIYTLQATSI